ncbi:MAG: RNA-binding domain-containing protein [Ignisphaera sp.]
MYIRIETEVRPTEDLNKVIRALKNLFNFKNIKVEELGNERKLIVIEENNIETLTKLRDILRKQRILDTARNILLKSYKGNVVEVKLNKQAAYQGVVSFVDSDNESPLGPINVVISSDKIELIIDWLTPKTSHGKPIWDLPTPTDT